MRAAAPTGLLTDFQNSPALGVRGTDGNAPVFSWIVPPCDGAPDAAQIAYQLIVTSEGAPVWDSGRVASSDSTYRPYAGPQLNASTRYSWTVSTWAAACASEPSAPALFIPALPLGGWNTGARFISVNTTRHVVFGYFRREVAVPDDAISAVVSLTAFVAEHLLCGYKLYFDDVLVNIGPGRSEAPVWADATSPGLFRTINFQTLDATDVLTPGSHTVALQTMFEPQPAAIFQVVFRLRGGGEAVVVSDESWLAFDGDAHRNPALGTHGHSAGVGLLEFIDARDEPVGWRAAGFQPDSAWAPAVATAPDATQVANFHARMQPPMQVVDLALAELRPASPLPSHQCGFVDENNVLELSCDDGSAITGVSFASFGTPTGTCPGSLAVGACNAATSRAIVEGLCVGKRTCSIEASDKVFGDPCE